MVFPGVPWSAQCQAASIEDSAFEVPTVPAPTIRKVNNKQATVDSARPYAFVRAGDGNLWVHWWTGRAWNWANQGSVGSGIAGGLGATIVADPSHRPYAFVRTNTGGLAVNWWE